MLTAFNSVQARFSPTSRAMFTTLALPFRLSILKNKLRILSARRMHGGDQAETFSTAVLSALRLLEVTIQVVGPPGYLK